MNGAVGSVLAIGSSGPVVIKLDNCYIEEPYDEVKSVFLN